MVESLTRVWIRRVRRDDFAWLHDLWREREVRRYLFDDTEISIDDASDLFEQSLAHAALWGGGLWAVFELSGGPGIGFVGLRRSSAHEPPELLFGLAPSHWGRGLASEAARQILRFAFEDLGAERLRAETDPPNVASQRVLVRLGMKAVPSLDASDQPTLRFEITREEWRF